MKKLLTIAVIAMLASCNSKKEKQTVTDSDTTAATVPANTTNTSTTPASTAGTLNYTVNDTARTQNATALVSKNKDNVSPGNEYIAMVTANGAYDESLTVNFAFNLKPGVYPVVGLGMQDGNHVFGGLMGGKPAVTKYKVNLTEVTDMGSNGVGGHNWKISGSIDEEVSIDAMSLMKLDPKHPDAIKLNKISFSNITFVDNMEEVLNKIKVN